ncbi:MAG: thioredoxin family protein [Gemmatimonadaceae bacterium]
MNDTVTGQSIAERFAQASTLENFVGRSVEHGALWHAIITRARKTEFPEDILTRARAIGEPRYVLVLLEDWCGDAVNTAPVIDALGIAVPSITVRVISRDANDDLMQAHLSPRGGRAIPAVIVYDEKFNEIGWWGSRPAALQKWVDTPDAQALEKKVRYAGARRWYVQDKGISTLNELVAILERKSA